MLLRGFTDAIMMRSQQAAGVPFAGLFAARALRPDILRPRHADDLLRRHAVRDRADELRRAAATRRAGRGVPDAQLRQLLADLRRARCWSTSPSWSVSSRAPAGCPTRRCPNSPTSPGVGVDYYLWSLQISGVGTLMSGVNLVTTVLKIHAPGMTYMRMPMFCWTTLASNLLIVAAFPILTATFAMLLLDRYLGFPLLHQRGRRQRDDVHEPHLGMGHPEVYILILPAFGVFSEVISTFSAKPLFGYRSMVMATMAICLLAFMVWLHHFFTMGAGGDVNGMFGGVDDDHRGADGVKIFNWMFTMFGGRVTLSPRRCCGRSAFMVTFVDRRHDRRAARRAAGRFHATQQPVPGGAFPQRHHRRRAVRRIRRLQFLVPQGVRLPPARGPGGASPRSGAGWSGSTSPSCRSTCWGSRGMTRRMQHYDVPELAPMADRRRLRRRCDPGRDHGLQVVQLVVSIRQRDALRDETGDPWDGRSLEWATPSPPPAFNFAVLPQCRGRGGLLGHQAEGAEHAT